MLDQTSRLELCLKQSILVKGKNAPIYDNNPYISRQPPPDQFNGAPQQQNDKLTIKNLPLSVSNEEVKNMLEGKGVELVSPIKYGFIRNDNGDLTTYKSGDRFVYTKPFSPPFPRKQDIGVFSCLVVHHGKNTTCRACNENGHKVGDPMCTAKPKETIVPFKGYQHVLSNHYPCQLVIYDKHFKSLEHAYFWRMSTEFGKHDLATEIQNSPHAGVAKKLSKRIADDEERLKWEQDNIAIMRELLEVKAEQCLPFHDCLIEHKDSVLAEATPSKYWATGVSPFVTQNCSPDFWPGQNMLGVLLMELTEALLQNDNNQKSENNDKNAAQDIQTVDDDNELSVNEEEQTEEQEKNMEGVADYVQLADEDEKEETIEQEENVEEVNGDAQPTNVTMTTVEHNYNQSIPSIKQSTSSDEHGSRSRDRVSTLTRSPRNASNSDRRHRSISSCRGNNKVPNKDKDKGKVNKQMKVKPQKGATSTPNQMNIRTAFGVKRKPAGSPDDQNDSKALRQDTGNT